MYFPVSGVEVFPLIPVGVAFVIAFACSMGGVSGAFLLLPFQVSFLGFTSPAVSPTNHVYNVISTPGGVWRFIREGRMLWPLALVIAMGTVPGTLAGSVLRLTLLPDPQVFKLFVSAVLLYIGLTMACSMARERSKRKNTSSGMKNFTGAKGLAAAAPEATAQTKAVCSTQNSAGTASENDNAKPLAKESGAPAFCVRVLEFSGKTIAYEFMGSVYSAPTKGVFWLCLVVGVVGGAYGIGGGAIIAPVLVSFFRLPVHTIAGTTLFGNFLTSLSGLLFFMCLSFFFPGQAVAPDWTLGLLFGLGGLGGVYCGARAQRFVPEKLIRALLVLILVATALRYVFEVWNG